MAFLGALKPKTDIRDYKIIVNTQEFPKAFICNYLPPIKNQKKINSCVAHATAAILEVFNKIETDNYISLSTDFIYGMQGIAFNRLDRGMYLRDACKIVQQYGDVSELIISGNTEQPECSEKLKYKLTQEIYNQAKKYRIKSYAKCKGEDEIKQALMNYGPLLASIKWYENYSINDDVISFDETSSFGYHAIMICGWTNKGWLCQNSWGSNWNKSGRFIYPFNKNFSEVWSFVDAKNDDVYIPKRNILLNHIYKILNFIINLIKSKR